MDGGGVGWGGSGVVLYEGASARLDVGAGVSWIRGRSHARLKIGAMEDARCFNLRLRGLVKFGKKGEDN